MREVPRKRARRETTTSPLAVMLIGPRIASNPRDAGRLAATCHWMALKKRRILQVESAPALDPIKGVITILARVAW